MWAQGFFDDQQPSTLFNFGSALVQPPTFVGTTGLGYVVTAGGDLVRFSLFVPGAGAPVVYSGQQVVAAQALASGQVVVVLADGAVDLLQPQGNGLTVESVLQAQGGVPALPSAIEVVNKPGGQFNVLVSSEGSDNIFVFAQVEVSGEAGGPFAGGSSAPALNSFQPPALGEREPDLLVDDERDRDERLRNGDEREHVGLDELELGVGDNDHVGRVVARHVLLIGQSLR